MAIDFDELKRRLTESVSLERTLRAERDFRGGAWRLFLELRALRELLPTVPVSDEAQASFVARVGPLLDQRMQTMREKNEYNPITLEVHECTEIDRFVLQRHLASEDHTERLDAVAAAAEVKYRGAMPDLLALLEREKHPFVISKLTKVVGQLGTAAQIPALVPFLSHEDDRIRANTVEGLDAIDDDAKFPHLMRLLDDPSPRVKAAALRAIRALGGTKFAQLVGRMMADPDDNVRRSVLFVLAGMHNPFARSRLIKFLRDDDPEIRCRAADLLVTYADPEAATGIVERLPSERTDRVREAFQTALRGMRSRVPPAAAARFDELIRTACAELEAAAKPAAPPSSPAPPAPVPQAAAPAVASPPSSPPPPPPGDEDDLLNELLALSVPGDIAPSRVAAVTTRGDTGEAEVADDAGSVDDEKAAMKLVTRMSTTLGTLPPAERRVAEGLIKAGKIKNESHLKQWIERSRQKRKLR